MGRVAVTAVALLCLLAVFNFHGVEGRSLLFTPPCSGNPGEIPYRPGSLTGYNCIPEPLSRTAKVGNLPLCHGSPRDLPGVNCLIGPGPVLSQNDPDCVPRPGALPPIKCQIPAGVTQTSPPAGTEPLSYGLAAAKVFEACKYTWQLPGTDCWPPIGESPRCNDLHGSGCAPTTPPSTANVHVAGIGSEVPWRLPGRSPTPTPPRSSVTGIDNEVPWRFPGRSPTPTPPRSSVTSIDNEIPWRLPGQRPTPTPPSSFVTGIDSEVPWRLPGQRPTPTPPSSTVTGIDSEVPWRLPGRSPTPTPPRSSVTGIDSEVPWRLPGSPRPPHA